MTGDNNSEPARRWAMLCHLSSIVWIPLSILFALVGIPIPLNILGPLFIWRAKKNEHPFIDAHGKESLNFQISLTIYIVMAIIVFMFLIGVTCGVGLNSTSSSASPLVTIGIGLTILGLILIPIVTVVQLGLAIFAAIKAKKGDFYRYPFTIRFLR